MKKILNIITLPLLFSGMLFLAGCEEELTPHTFEGNDMPQVYVRTLMPDNTITTGNSFGSSVKQIVGLYPPTSGVNMLYFKLPAWVTKSMPSDAEVTFELDRSMFETYNAITSTQKADMLPDGFVVDIGSGKVTIPAGEKISKDSLEVTVTIPDPSLIPLGRYVIPVKIASVSGGAEIASTNNAFYIPFEFSSNTIDNRTTAPSGSAQTSFSGWTVTSTPALTNPNNMLSTTTNSYATLSSAQELTFTVDMASARSNVGGFRIHVSGSAYQWSKIKVETSTDNTTWVEQGTPTLSLTSNYHYIAFRERVPSVRYVRVSVLEWPSATASFRIAVFQAYW